jgi:hypothetical protein
MHYMALAPLPVPEGKDDAPDASQSKRRLQVCDGGSGGGGGGDGGICLSTCVYSMIWSLC